MYRQEVPQYGTLPHSRPPRRCRHRLDVPGRWGAWVSKGMVPFGWGWGKELASMRRIFAVMGMLPVGYYDLSVAGVSVHSTALEVLVTSGRLQADPITYEDFLPVSAAGNFQSNLSSTGLKTYVANEARATFEAALGVPVLDEISLYEAAQARSITVLAFSPVIDEVLA